MRDKRSSQREYLAKMLKYVDLEIVFAEVPDEITLAISISGCPHRCPNCHSSYLAEDIGMPLTTKVIDALVRDNQGISCICFMGGDSNPAYLNSLAKYIKEEYPSIKVAWYSGNEEINGVNLWNFDYIKVGPYIEKLGPLTSETTNQIMYHIVHLSSGKSKLYDITYKFRKKHETED